jgi:Fe(II)/alpha-ketoglutarate-dependent arginine beta-hydroxylase
MKTLQLDRGEIDDITALIGALTATYHDTESQEFLDDIALYSHQLPFRVRKFLNEFRHGYIPDGLCKIGGYPIDGQRLGATPRHWKYREDIVSSLPERIYQFLCASLLGDPFGWSTQQSGRITHDVFPIAEYEYEQLGFSSKETLTWHTEDAFHAYRPDYLALLCLRNPDHIGTFCGRPDYEVLSNEQLEYLFGQNYTIRPDNSHLSVNNCLTESSPAADVEYKSFEAIERMRQTPEKVSVLFGSRNAPFLRIDPYFMEPAEDPRAQDALDALIGSIDANYAEYPLHQGDILFINNLRVVHGRKSFTARYDGTDRWLKRVLVSRDLAKSRDRRHEDYSRIIV